MNLEPSDIRIDIRKGRLFFSLPVEIVKRAAAKDEVPMPRLTRRLQEILDGISAGLSNKEIANKINLSVRTVKFHVADLFQRFDVHSRVELYSIFGVKRQ